MVTGGKPAACGLREELCSVALAAVSFSARLCSSQMLHRATPEAPKRCLAHGERTMLVILDFSLMFAKIIASVE